MVLNKPWGGGEPEIWAEQGDQTTLCFPPVGNLYVGQLKFFTALPMFVNDCESWALILSYNKF